MINGDSLDAVGRAQWTAQFMRPLYGSYCFSQIPRLIRGLLTGEAAGAPTQLAGSLWGGYDRVVLFFIDAFGWRFFEPYCEQSVFLQRIVREGLVNKLTSQFPSTTAAHVTAIHTGLPVGQSGVYEWFYYEPLVDRIIAPLMFSFAGDSNRHTLAAMHIPAEAFFPQTNLYQDLQAQGIRSYVFQQRDYTPSPYTDAVTQGAEVLAYNTLPEALASLADLLLGERGRAYYFLYFDKVDAVCHIHGPTSRQLAREIEAFLGVMESVFYKRVAGKLSNTLVMLTADHGQAAIDPATTVYLNTALPDITRYLKTNKEGRLLAPAGSPRDMFLHVRPEYVEEAQSAVQTLLTGKAEVHRVADLIAQGFFGEGEPSAEFRRRAADLVVLPYEGESVWWYEKDRFHQGYYGYHGGLTRAEMETILLLQPYG